MSHHDQEIGRVAAQLGGAVRSLAMLLELEERLEHLRRRVDALERQRTLSQEDQDTLDQLSARARHNVRRLERIVASASASV